MDEVSRIDDFFADRTLAPTIEDLYRWLLRRALAWLDENHLDLKTVTVKQVKDWIEKEKFGNSAAYQTATVLRLFASWLYGKDTPLARLRIKLIDPGPQTTLNRRQVETIKQKLETPITADYDEALFNARRLRNLAIFLLALDTGLRASELTGAKIENLNLEERRLEVFGKGRKWRKVIFSPKTAEGLSTWLQTREKYLSPGVNTVFISLGGKKGIAGKPLTRSGINQIVKNVGKSVGIKMSAHALRRSFATISIQNGAPTRLVQIQGGWANLSMVERYTRKLEAGDFDGFFATGKS